MSEQNNSFSSSLGAIMAAVGSAVGLGNIWRFPYICGKYGGGAFLIVYVLFVFLIGMMLMMSEFVIGRRAQHAPMKAFETLAPGKKGWKYVGLFGTITCVFILSQYWVISGWTLDYFYDSCTGAVKALGQDANLIANHFSAFSTAVGRPLVFLGIFAVAVSVVILGGVKKGIEAVSKTLMPVLVLIVLALCVRSLTLPNASAGLRYLFNPDFSKLTGEGILAALGQALFSLSVGMGTMIVYGMYLPMDDKILKTSLWIAGSDTLIAILAGVAIFPAVFSCGMEPAGGFGLVFNVLPSVFNSMGALASVVSALFFLLLVLAALTSAISLLEAITAWHTETFKSTRLSATLLVALVTVAIAVVCSLSMGVWSNVHIGGLGIFDFVDCLNTIYLPPLTAIGTVLFVGWVMKKENLIDEFSNHGKEKVNFFNFYYFVVRFVAPLALAIVLVSGIINS